MLQKESILIIDDDKLNIIALTRILGADYQVYFEGDGESGIHSAKTFKPDLILLDLVMPKMSGYDVIKILKADEETRNIPVIFLTGRRDVQDEEAGFVLGAIDYITKPFSASVVKLRVGNQLKIVNQMRMIHNLSMEDALTGISNRHHFNNVLTREWERSVRQQLPLAFVIVDIDNFKTYNDTYGHLSGDAILKDTAKIIMNGVSKGKDCVARWSGKEFAIILPETNLAGAMAIAENIRQNVEATTFEIKDNVTTNIVVSIGVNSVIAEQDENYTLRDFISNTDAALTIAKKQGSNRVMPAEM